MADRQGQTHAVLELHLEPANPNRSPSVVYCAEVRFLLGTHAVISVQDDGTETLHKALRHAAVKMGRSL
jgi:hypothetical protein